MIEVFMGKGKTVGEDAGFFSDMKQKQTAYKQAQKEHDNGVKRLS